MPVIHVNEPQIATELRLSGSGPLGSEFPTAEITVTDYAGALRLSIMGSFGQTEDALRQKLVHSIDPRLEDRVGELVTKIIEERRSWCAGRVAPDEEHPADASLDVVRADILDALKELFHQEPDLPHEKPDPLTQPPAEPAPALVIPPDEPF